MGRRIQSARRRGSTAAVVPCLVCALAGPAFSCLGGGCVHFGGQEAVFPQSHGGGVSVLNNQAPKGRPALARPALPEHWDALMALDVESVSLWPAAHAAEMPTLDPAVKYLLGADGKPLVDPMSGRPLVDDWWNAVVGAQCFLLKGLDRVLRSVGVPGAWGWSIVVYMSLFKALTYPVQAASLRSTKLMSAIAPNVKRVQEASRGDTEKEAAVTFKIYEIFGVDLRGACLPVLATLPFYWTIYAAWRRLRAEGFEHYDESWLWIPSLGRPNPDFQFNLDWLLTFDARGEPAIGWHDYTANLALPLLLITYGVWNAWKGQAASATQQPQKEENGFTKNIPWFSVLLTAWITLELPQAVSVYYACNLLGTEAQTALATWRLREEVEGYKEYEATGEFPEEVFMKKVKAGTDALLRTAPATQAEAPVSLHDAAQRGLDEYVEALLGPGLDADAPDKNGTTALQYAVRNGHASTAALLLARGASARRPDAAGNTPFHLAAALGNLPVLRALAAGDEAPGSASCLSITNAEGVTPLSLLLASGTNILEVRAFLAEQVQAEGAPVEGARASPAMPTAEAAASRARRID